MNATLALDSHQLGFAKASTVFLTRHAVTLLRAVRLLLDVRVVVIKQMAAKTMRLLSSCAPTDAAIDVFAVRHRFEVVGVHAAGHATQMIKVQVRRDWPDKLLIDPSVRIVPMVIDV
jgi:hypothetical protein